MFHGGDLDVLNFRFAIYLLILRLALYRRFL
jgi:hypothetical protein